MSVWTNATGAALSGAISGRLRRMVNFGVAALALMLWLNASVVMAAQPQVGAVAGNGTKKLLIVGSSAMGPMVEDLARQFRKRRPDVEIAVEIRNSARGVADVQSGRADIGMVSRELKAEEKTLFVLPVARDGVVIVVNKNNPVKELSLTQLASIFTGRVTNWMMAGWDSRPVEVVNRAEGQGLTELLPAYLAIKYQDIKAVRTVNDTADLVEYLSSHPGAISYVSSGLVTEMLAKGLPVKPIRLEGVEPGPTSIRDGSWPISRSLSLVTRNVPSGAVREFIQFALSPEVQATIRAHDFVPY